MLRTSPKPGVVPSPNGGLITKCFHRNWDVPPGGGSDRSLGVPGVLLGPDIGGLISTEYSQCSHARHAAECEVKEDHVVVVVAFF